MIVPTLMVALATLAQNPGGPAKSWVAYTSRDGNFIVDMPRNPSRTFSRTVSSGRGRLKVVMARCDSPDVDYIAEKIEFSQANRLDNRAVEELLDFQRDSIAQEFNGKVVTQKKLRLDGGAPGSDFTIEGRPEGKAGVSTIRVREYFAQRVIYALIAVTAPDRELPEDAGRFFGSFTIGTNRTKPVGPQPEPAGKPLGKWGVAVDPDGDCKLKDEGKALAIEVPGTLHDLNADINKFNAPRVVREVTGDFSVTVKVVGDFKPGEKALNPKSVPYNGGGIFAWQDSDNYIRLERSAILRNGKPGTFVDFEEREWGSRAAVNNGKLGPGTAYLRLERRGNRIHGFTSANGKDWAALEPIATSWPPRIKVGLNAINSSGDPFAVRFEDFQFTAGKAATAAKP